MRSWQQIIVGLCTVFVLTLQTTESGASDRRIGFGNSFFARKPQNVVKIPLPGPAYDAIISSDGKFAAVTYNHHIHVWDLAAQRVTFRIRYKEVLRTPVRAVSDEGPERRTVALSAEGKHLLCALPDSAEIWGTTNGKRIYKGTYRKAACFWRDHVERIQLRFIYRDQPDWIFSPDVTHAWTYAGGDAVKYQLNDLDDDELLVEVARIPIVRHFKGMTFSRGGSKVLTGEQVFPLVGDRTVRVWDANTSQELVNFDLTSALPSDRPNPNSISKRCELAFYSPCEEYVLLRPVVGAQFICSARTGERLLSTPNGDHQDTYNGPRLEHRVISGTDWIGFAPQRDHVLGIKQITELDFSVKNNTQYKYRHFLFRQHLHNPNKQESIELDFQARGRLDFYISGQDAFMLRDGKGVVTASRDHDPQADYLKQAKTPTDVRVWDATTGQLRWKVAVPGRATAVGVPIKSNGRFAVSATGQYLATCTPTDGVQFWIPKKNKQPVTLNKEMTFATKIAVSPDGQFVAVLADDGKGYLWTTSNPVEQFNLHLRHPLSDLDFSPQAPLLALGYKNGQILLRNLNTGKFEDRIKGHTGKCDCVRFHVDGKSLLSRVETDVAILWDIETGEEVARFSPSIFVQHKRELFSQGRFYDYPLMVTSDGRFLVSSGYDHMAIWDVKTGARLRTVSNLGLLTLLRVSADGRWIVSSNPYAGRVMVHSIDGELVAEYSYRTPEISVSRDGSAMLLNTRQEGPPTIYWVRNDLKTQSTSR